MSEPFDNDKFDVQTRSEKHGMAYYETCKEALEAAKEDQSIWKISFAHKDERIRLVKEAGEWIYEPII